MDKEEAGVDFLAVMTMRSQVKSQDPTSPSLSWNQTTDFV